MFTGIIEQQGTVQKRTKDRLFIESASTFVQELSLGASVAVNGACLTVSDIPEKTVFAADVMPETVRRTTLGSLEQDSSVNLELPLKADGRFGGHIVQGHVDGTAKVTNVGRSGNSRVVAAHWREETSSWELVLESGARHSTRFLVTAIGVLSAAVMPTIPGIDSFTGQSCHTQRWPKDGIEFAGKRVGIMERRIYSGPPLTEGELKARSEGQRRLGLEATPPMKAGDVFAMGVADSDKPAGFGASDQVRARPGSHEIAFVHRDGRRLAKHINVRDEVYIGVTFAEMRVTGGE